MLVLLAILLPVRGEWVEIAQTTYRRTSFQRVPSTTELPPEAAKNYPNATPGGPDWHTGYVTRVGDVRRIPGAPPRRPAPARPGGAGAANKQEYYDIDSPHEVSVHGVPPHGHENTEVPGRLNSLDHEEGLPENAEGNRATRRPSLETGSVKEVKRKNLQQTRIVDEQSQYQKGQRISLNKNQKATIEDHLNLHKIIQHFVETLKKPDEQPLSKNITKDVEVDMENTLTPTASSEKSNDETDSNTIPEISLDKNKYFPEILRIFKSVASVISKNTQRGVNSKIKYLEDLKNQLLFNIQERIDAVWPGAERAARQARGHVDMPSSEGALMTISFLTFAVFLIKLVLQIIHTYKNKTMMMTPAVVTAVGRAAAAATRAKN